MRLLGSVLVVALAALACRSAPPPPPKPPAPAPAPVLRGEPGVTRRTVPGERPIEQVMPFFSKPRPGQSR